MSTTGKLYHCTVWSDDKGMSLRVIAEFTPKIFTPYEMLNAGTKIAGKCFMPNRLHAEYEKISPDKPLFFTTKEECLVAKTIRLKRK